MKVTPDGLIVDTAPILGQWRREQFNEFREFAGRQGWRVERVPRADGDES
jgi:hypothetical protein